MGCVGSDGEDELRASSRISKRFKFSKKFFDDCTAVDYASVPRKLRSAIKKRSRESAAPHLRIPKKLNRTGDGIELQRKHGLKKFKVSTKRSVSGGSVSEVVVGPITKDEEEVAETLYALAGLCPDTAAKDKTKLEGGSLETKSTAFPDRENSRSAAEAILKEEAGTKTISQVDVEAPNQSSNVGGSAEGGVRIQPSHDVSLTEKYLRRKLSAELHNGGPKLNVPSTVLNSDVEHGTQRLSCNTVVAGDLSSTNKGPGSNILQPELSLTGGKNSERAFRSAAFIGGQHELLHNASESKSNGPVLWPGLSSTESHDSHMQGPSLQSSTAKLPAIFLNTNCSLEPSRLENSVTTKKDAQVLVDSKKSWKRCSAHVHISHLIKVLPKTERGDTLQIQSTQSTIREGINQGALISSNNLTERSNGLNRRIPSTNSIVCSAAERNSLEARNAILLRERLLQDQQQTSIDSSVCSAAERSSSEVRNAILLHQTLFQDQQKASTSDAVCSAAQRNSSEVGNAILLHQRLLQDQQQATTSGLYSLQKQNFNFFPLSGGGARGETSHGAAKADPGTGTVAQVRIPYLQSKNHPDVPFLVHQNSYSSTPSISNPGAAAAQKVQLSPYLGGTSYAPLMGVTSSSKQQAWQQQQQNWSDQLPAHRKPGQVSAPNIQNLQGVQDAPSLFHYAQSLFPPTHSSVQVLNSNYALRQQQPLISGPPSLPPSKLQGLHHHMTYGHQGNGGGRHPESVPPLQLLCNEHI